MTIALELGKTLDEIGEISLDELTLWIAFFKEQERKIQKNSKSRG